MNRDLAKRIVEALLFAAEEPLDVPTIQAHLSGDVHAGELLDELVQVGLLGPALDAASPAAPEDGRLPSVDDTEA